jgi:hypothetical protein
MLLLDNKDRDAIVSFLEAIVVPAQTGANIMQVTALLKKLEEQPSNPETPNE